jgi:hypothetical protein
MKKPGCKMTHISGNIFGRRKHMHTTKFQRKCGFGNTVNIKILANLYETCA